MFLPLAFITLFFRNGGNIKVEILYRILDNGNGLAVRNIGYGINNRSINGGDYLIFFVFKLEITPRRNVILYGLNLRNDDV